MTVYSDRGFYYKQNKIFIEQNFYRSKFISIIKAISVSKAELNRKILKYFKKDFYTLFCSDIQTILDNKVDKIIEPEINVKDTKSKLKNNEVNIIENYNEILTVSKKKTSKSKINIIDDNVILEEEQEIKVKKNIKKKVKTNTDIEL